MNEIPLGGCTVQEGCFFQRPMLSGASIFSVLSRKEERRSDGFFWLTEFRSVDTLVRYHELHSQREEDWLWRRLKVGRRQHATVLLWEGCWTTTMQ